MDSGKRVIVKNASVMMVAQIITWVLAITLALYLPAYLGADLVGQVAIAASIWAIASVLITFGTDTHLTKTIARTPEQTSQLLGATILVRGLLFVIVFIIVWFYIAAMHYAGQVQAIALIFAVSTLTSLIGATLSAALNGLEHMQFISVATVVSKALLVGLSFLGIVLGVSVYLIVAANVVAALIGTAILLYGVTRYYPIHWRLPPAYLREIVQQSWPYLITALTLAVYQQLDQLIIASLVNTKAVGYYSTAMQLFGTLMFLPAVFGTAVFPILARSFANGQGEMNTIVKRGVDLIMLMSLPIGLGTVVIAEPLMVQIFSEQFRPAGQILSVLGVVLIFTYMNTLLGQLFISIDRTMRLNLIMLVAILVTVPLDLVLVPWSQYTFHNGALGGALSFLVTEFGMCVMSLLLLPRGTLGWSNVRNVSLILVAAVLMMATSWWWRESSLVLAVLAGGVVYCGAVVALRIIPQQDWDLLHSAVRGALTRIRTKMRPQVEIGSR